MLPQPLLRAHPLLRRSVTPFLMLVTPLVLFIQHHQYGFARPEIVTALLVFVAVALLMGAAARWSRRLEVATIAMLLTWFADIQLDDPGEKRLVLLFVMLSGVFWVLREHAARIMFFMMATVLAGSLLAPHGGVAASPPLPQGREVASAHAAGRSGLPLIIHLVFDEHIGVEGFPDDLTPRSFKEATRSFFVDRGFRLFGNAYSEHAWTQLSLAHLLNLTPGRYVSDLVVPGAGYGTYRLTRNAYFERFEQKGYAIRVYRSGHVDVCADRVAPNACRSYNETSLAVLHDLPLSAVEKLSILTGNFLGLSDAVVRLHVEYRRSRQRLLKAGVHLPAWNRDRNIVAPVATMGVLDTIAADVARAQSGELIFAHLLLPHFPYVYDSACHPRPPSEWRHRRDRDNVDTEAGDSNGRAGRAHRYSLYLQQMRCAHRKMDQLISAIPPSLKNDAVVIIQSDHGSRIGIVEPNTRRESLFSATDYADFFSTLFAVRSAGLGAGYDLRRASITCLLRTLAESNFTSLATLNACSSPNVVFFNDHTPHVLSDFPAGVTRRDDSGPMAH
jgi:hypothetical protein